MTISPRYIPFLLLLLPLTGTAQSLPWDETIEAAPKWDCDEHSRDTAHIIWKSDPSGSFAGALAVENGTILVGSSDFKTCSMDAFDVSGRRRWSAKHPSLQSRVHDYGQPLRCRPCIDGDRAYYMSNRGELVCVNLHGDPKASQNTADGPSKDAPALEDVHIVWKIDLMRELGVFKRDASDVGNPLPSPLVIGDLVFCVTAHGVPPGGEERADPKPPSFLAVHKLTGEVAWSSNAPGANIVFSQWASPVSARVNGIEQVIFPGGDGILYGFEPATGKPLWKLDCNAPGARDRFVDPTVQTHLMDARCGFFANPTVHDTMLYVALNENYEVPKPHPLLAVDLAAADGQPKIAWQFGPPAFKGTYTSAAVGDGLIFVTSDDTMLFALDEKTGRECWQAELEQGGRNLCPSPVIYRGRVYAAGESTIAVFKVSREKKCLGQYQFDEAYIDTPDFAGDAMFVAVGKHAFALRLPPK